MAGSWVPDNAPGNGFSLANIPFGIVSTTEDESPHVAVAIGESVLDLKVISSHPSFPQLFPSLEGHKNVFSQPTLNDFAALGRPVHREVRKGLQGLLSVDTERPEFLRDNAELRSKALLPQRDVKMHLPMQIGDYTDFYAGYHHAFKVGSLFRGPQNALQPNYTHLPVGYHGRASSIVVSGTPIRRPRGQILLNPAAEVKQPTTGLCRKLDLELELGCFICRPNEMGEAVNVDDADDHIFGYVLLNDWSARDIQAWEYVPLGPFNSKNFASTISAWVVLADALEPFRTNPIENKTDLQAYLKEGRAESVFDIQLEVDITMPEGKTLTVTRTSSKNLMWSFPQMIAHHTIGGCPLRTGDLLGSGTISGPGPRERGSMLEMSQEEIRESGMDPREFLLRDDETVTLRGFCAKAGNQEMTVGFGPCSGRTYSPKS